MWRKDLQRRRDLSQTKMVDCFLWNKSFFSRCPSTICSQSSTLRSKLITEVSSEILIVRKKSKKWGSRKLSRVDRGLKLFNSKKLRLQRNQGWYKWMIMPRLWYLSVIVFIKKVSQWSRMSLRIMIPHSPCFMLKQAL